MSSIDEKRHNQFVQQPEAHRSDEAKGPAA